MTQPTEFKFKMEPTGGRPFSPMLRFRGTLKEVTPTVYKNEEDPSAKERMTVKFDFTDVTVIDTEEPYPFPTATGSLPYSDRGDTIWMAWATSFRNIVPKSDWQNLSMPFKVLEGKVQEWAYLPARLRRPLTDENGENIKGADGRDKWGVQDADAWQLVSVEGYTGESGATIYDLIVEKLDGSDDKGFMEWLFTDMSLKSVPGHNAAVEAQAERKLIPMLLETGKLSQDPNGVYHKVG